MTGRAGAGPAARGAGAGRVASGRPGALRPLPALRSLLALRPFRPLRPFPSRGLVRPLPGTFSSSPTVRFSPSVAVQDAQYTSSFAVKLIHSRSATGVPKAPYMLRAATPWR